MQQEKQAGRIKRLPIVLDDPARYFLPFVESDAIYEVYRREGFDYFMSRVLRKLQFPGHAEPLFHDWRKTLNRGGKVVVFDSALNADILARLKKHRSQVILFFWNRLQTVRAFCPAIMDYLDQFTIYSHDRNDCRDYGFKFNTAFYAARPTVHQPPQLTTDVIYIGGNKNRMERIIQTHEQLRGLALDYHVYDPPHAGQSLADGLIAQGQFLPYTDYLDRMMASRCVLEILQPGQDSLTLRAMEALFYKKKLLTNHQQIVNEPFYNPVNILVFEDPRTLDAAKVHSFLSTPAVPVDPKVIEDFTYAKWLARFE